LVGSRWAKIEIFEQKCSPGRMLWRKPAWWLNTRTIRLNMGGFWADIILIKKFVLESPHPS
jgi:hypothetical protein